jgi:O-antigen/teichoic acid export membrane protein
LSLKKNVIANFIGQGWTAVMGLAFMPIYIRYLGLEAYGLIGFYAVLQAWFTLLDMGITQTLNREMARYAGGSYTAKSILDLLRSLEIVALVIGLFICLIVWFTSNWIATYWLKANALGTLSLSHALTLMGIVIALRFIEGIYRGALLGLQHQVTVNLINMFFSTLRFGVVIALLHFYKASIEVFFVWQAICSFLSILTFATFVYKAIPATYDSPKFSFIAINQVKSFAKGVMGITFLALLLTQVDKVLMSNLLSLEEYGIYTLASTIAGGLALVTGPITQAFYPKLVEYAAKEDSASLIDTYHQGSQLISTIVIPVALMLVFFGGQILTLWSNNQTLAEATTPILLPLILGSMLNCLIWMPYQLQLAYGWTSFAIKLNSVAVVLLVPSIYFLTLKYGAIGAAWAWALLNLSYITIGMHFMYKKLLPDEKWKWYWQDILKQFICISIVTYVGGFIATNVAQSKLVLVALLTLTTLITLIIGGLVSNRIKPLLLNTIRA